ncbi:MAG: PIG-L family deacetylase [Magnetospirillum sp.]|nr:PIG-L family deacetylase [Magnetospirillum sp.]
MTVLVVAAHPDDEVLGCGGAMARHAAQGETVHVLILAEGATSRADRRDVTAHGAELEGLRKAATDAARCLGVQPPRFAGFPDNRMDSVDLLDVVKAVEAVIAETQPDTVYCHWGADLNVDHRVTHEAVLTACRPLPGSSVRRILAWETVSSTEWGLQPFQPNSFVGLDQDCLERKRQALICYASEMRDFPHARSMEAVEALARLRGANVGLPAAEAFVLIRSVEPAA